MTEQEKIFANRLMEIVKKRKETDTEDLDHGITIGMQSVLIMLENFFK